MKSISPLCHFIALLLLINSSGCQQRLASKLQGSWEGRPDSVAARAEREAEKYGDAPAGSATVGSATQAGELVAVTDWENYETRILLDFLNDERLEMSLAGDKQSLSGAWEIISTSPAGCTIEVETSLDARAGEAPVVERRRFDLLLDEREGTCVGFQLTETGADPQLGALYFRRPQSSSADQPNSIR